MKRRPKDSFVRRVDKMGEVNSKGVEKDNENLGGKLLGMAWFILFIVGFGTGKWFPLEFFNLLLSDII